MTPETLVWREIVGIARDQNKVSRAQPARAEVFASRSQDWGRTNWMVLRTSVPPLSVVATVREVMREVAAVGKGRVRELMSQVAQTSSSSRPGARGGTQG